MTDAPAPAPIEAVVEPETSQGVAVYDTDAEPQARTISVRPLPVEEGLRRIARRRQLAALATTGTTEGEQERREREAREAEEVERARRHQAETRRHFETVAQERLETLVEDVAEAVFARVLDRIERGIADMQTEQAIRLDRVAADVRSQVRAFLRGAGA